MQTTARTGEKPQEVQAVAAGQATSQAEPEKEAGERQEEQVELEEQATQYCRQGAHTLLGRVARLSQ